MDFKLKFDEDGITEESSSRLKGAFKACPMTQIIGHKSGSLGGGYRTPSSWIPSQVAQIIPGDSLVDSAHLLRLVRVV